MEKIFDFNSREPALFKEWQENGYFQADENSDRETHVQMMPPPNVTGSLHAGHTLFGTLQDTLARYNRLKGKDVLWQPGMDHASIAVHMVLEKQLVEKGTNRFEMGREKFLERAWEWRNESGGNISGQMNRLGFSPDWSRERFTLDEDMNRAVRKAFVQMYEDGLIYRDKRLVNWDVERQTAISDIEIKQKETTGKMYYFNYPLVDNPSQFITVATTRPETMLGDTGVVVNPEDKRYRDLIGKKVKLPLVGREIPIEADEHADPESGSGAVKITPAHDFNDFEIGREHGFEVVNIFDQYACINDNAPEQFQGLSREEARAAVVEALEELGLVVKIEDHQMQLPVGERSGIVVEPYLTDQWYVDAKKLAGSAIDAVRNGDMTFYPKQWENTYFAWMENIQPWCISRQLWWGHRIPIWYGPDEEYFCAENEQEAQELADKHYGKAVELRQETDILDTWFSSGLWCFSTLGWPDQTKALERYYPGDVLITGFDIIFFWVARMMMMSLYFMDEVPFKDCYITPLVRDKNGQKMSKSRGNVVDPIELVNKYGADALRFTMCSMAVQGRDIALDESRIEGYRNFGTKLWNAARFLDMNECVSVDDFDSSKVKQPVNQWIIDKLEKTRDAVDEALSQYRFNDYASTLYHFIWDDFCDWYVEFSKADLYGDNEENKTETKQTAAWVLEKALIMLHPVMPFITDEIYRQIKQTDQTIAVAEWPSAFKNPCTKETTAELDWVISLIQAIRNVKGTLNLPGGEPLSVTIEIDEGHNAEDMLERHSDKIHRLIKLNDIKAISSPSERAPKSAQTVFGQTTVSIDIDGLIDIESEIKRVEQEIQTTEADIKKFQSKLANENFVSRAPEEVVEKEKRKLEEAEGIKQKLDSIYQTLDKIAKA